MRRSAALGVVVLAAAAWFVAPAPAGAASRIVTLRSPTFTLSGFQVRLPKIHVHAPHRDGWVTAMDVRLVRPDGGRASIRGVMLHHVVFLNDGRFISQNRGSCAGRHGEPFYGTGEERERLILPPGYGYRVHAHDHWRMQAMLMSHTLRPQRVAVQYTFRLVTGRALRPVRPFWIRASGCGAEHPSYPVFGGGAPGSTSTRTWTWEVPMNGRIVAAGGHLHAGARDMFLTDPGCGGRRLLDTRPTYASPTDLVYRLRPVLHEPGPVATRYFLSARGIPVRRGQRLELTGAYDGQWPRSAVMAIMHVYVAAGPAPRTRCPGAPADAHELLLRHDGRSDPPHRVVPLNVLGADGHVRAVDELDGPVVRADGAAQVAVRAGGFFPRRLSLPVGARLTWRFFDRVAHIAFFANGPALMGTPILRAGGVHSVTVSRPGRYELFCWLHPVTMQQEVIVRPD